MRTKGKGRKSFCRFPKPSGSIAYGIQDDSVRNSSLHCVPKISPRLPVKRDFRSHCERRYSPYENRDPFSCANLEKDEQDILRCSEETTDKRNEVKKIVGLYREILDKLLRENNKLTGRMPNMHQNAALLLQKRINFPNREKRIGSVPGVEIGDEFLCRAELFIIGLHLQFYRGIDYMVQDGTVLATSVVESHRYPNTMNSNGDLIYVGEGGKPVYNGCHGKDQVLKQGNLALKNSMYRRSPVRVIRKRTVEKTAYYVYDGLHLVEKYWREKGPYNKFIFKFQFRRIPEQPTSPLGFPCTRDHKQGVIMKDLSRGKEKVPIVVVNTIDDARPSGFAYTVNSTLNTNHVCAGCDCDDGCSDSEDCSCKVKNEREFGYDYCERLRRRRSFVYECGPSCKCFDSCINKVSQRGIRFELEVFKTESKGWGVRSRTNIPSGSFVCEYAGEFLKLKEVNQNGIDDDDYLFIIRNSKNDKVLAIDAAGQGNVGRFINHSCSPNLCVQNVYISPDFEVPHVMFFAMKDINPFEELTYDYNYRLGYKKLNLKAKNCNCGSGNCVGTFY